LRHFYARSPFAADGLAALERLLERPATRLVDASMPALGFLTDQFRITTPLLVSSALGLERQYLERFPDQPGATHRIIAFLQALGARELLEGESGRAYLDVAPCERHGIRVAVHQYAHPTYRQLHEPFISHLSALDLLLCAGPDEARRVLQAVP